MMHPRARRLNRILAFAFLAAVASGAAHLAAQPTAGGLRVEISFSAAARTEPGTGMVYLPIKVAADTDLVKRIKIQSQVLTKWWGQPIFLGATILLPKDYAQHPEVLYPVNYIQGHFSLGAPGGFGRGGDFDKLWLAENTP